MERRSQRATAISIQFFSKINTNYDADEALPKPQKMAWRASALCRALPPEEKAELQGGSGKNYKRDHYPLVRKVCEACPVKDDCLAAALHEEGNDALAYRFGMRGGKTPRERRQMFVDLHGGKPPKNTNKHMMRLIRRGTNQYQPLTSEEQT